MDKKEKITTNSNIYYPKKEVWLIEAIFAKLWKYAYVENIDVDMFRRYKQVYEFYYSIEDKIFNNSITYYYKLIKGNVKFLRWKYLSNVEIFIENFVLYIFNEYAKILVIYVYKNYYLFLKEKFKYINIEYLKYRTKLENYFMNKFETVNAQINREDFIIKQNRCLTYFEVVNMLNRRQKGKYYAPYLSFWPLFLTSSLALFLLFISIFLHSVKLYEYLNLLTFISLLAVIISISFWFSIFFLEKKKGNHLVEVRRNIQLGFYLFLFTEILCFVALFWVFFHSFLAASLHVGIYNPGEGIANLYINEFVSVNKNWNVHYFKTVGTPSYFRISTLYTMMDRELYKTKDIKLHVIFYDRGQLVNPYKLPLLNTFILLTSAASLNLSHVSVRTSKYLNSFFWLFVTILLGLLFVSVQFKEYKSCSFQYNDGIFAACFFSLTGLHGIHVIIGISALLICSINLLFHNYSPNFHQSYAYSIFYWHFVDVVWVLVYFVIYLWPASYFFVDELYTTYKTFFTAHFSKNYFKKVFNLNTFYEYKFNDKLIYNYFCKNFCIKFINWDIMDLGVSNDFDFEKFFYPKYKTFYNFSDFYASKVKNLEEISAIYGKYINNKDATPVVIADLRAARYSGYLLNNTINIPVYYETVSSQSYKLESIKSTLSVDEMFAFYNECSNYKKLNTLSRSDIRKLGFNEVIKKYFISAHELNAYRSSMLFDYDVEYEFLRNEFIKGNVVLNYNEVKKDPIVFCFILTEMNNSLVNAVECAYYYDLKNKYKRLMIFKILGLFHLKSLQHVWGYFFFPYANSKDASVRYIF